MSSLGTDKEKTVLVPQNKFYNELGQECVGVGCSVDLFLFNNAYIDVATLSQVILFFNNIFLRWKPYLVFFRCVD